MSWNSPLSNVPPGSELWLTKARMRLRRRARRIAQFNPMRRARRNVAHHYDLSGALFDLFLDADRQYSCAYFEHPKMTLEAAQTAKKRHIAAKLMLDRPGLKVLDIGSGWGGLALDLARDAQADVLGVTLSTEQLAMSNARAQSSGLAERCRFELTDYRSIKGPFDRVVSVGMFEHVGVTYYDAFFAKLRDLLAPDGVALLHTIGRTDGPGTTDPWTTKYIFPGGYTPAMSEVLAAIERSGLYVTDVEVLAPALCRDAQGVAVALPQEPGKGCCALRRAVLPDVGALSRERGDELPLRPKCGVSVPALQASGHSALDSRLHARCGAAGVIRSRRDTRSSLARPRRRKLTVRLPLAKNAG